MRRREFLGVLGGGAAAAWPLAARAQQGERVRRIGVLSTIAADDPAIPVFLKLLQELGWSGPRNLRIELRRAEADAKLRTKYAAELAALAPDVILATGSGATGAMLAATRTVPIVFVQVADPVASGFVVSLPRPGGNVTGFTNFEVTISGKWLELLRQIAPKVTHAAVVHDATVANGIAQFNAIQAAAPSLGLELTPIDLGEASEFERALTTYAQSPNGGLIVTGGALALTHRNLIIALAGRHKLPAAYSDRVFVTAGGLISYGPDRVDQFRRAVSYVDRILKGEKPANLPVQAPVKYELAINLQTARALGLTVPQSLLATANEVVE